MDLDRLNKMLTTHEVAEHIYNIDNGKTMLELTAIAKAANEDEDDEEDTENGVPSNIINALKHVKAPTTGISSRIPGKQITLGQNRSAISLHGNPSIKPKCSSDVTAEGEVPWIGKAQPPQISLNLRKAIKAEVKTMTKESLRQAKDAILLSVSNRQAVQENQAVVNSKSLELLHRKLHKDRALQVETAKLTPAQASILAKPSNAEGSVKQSVRVQGDDKPAFRLPDYDVAACMPEEFRRKPKIEATKDNRFVTLAAKTIDRSAILKQDVPNPRNTPQGEIADRYWNGNEPPKPTSLTNSGPDSYKDSEQKKTRQPGYETSAKGLRGAKISGDSQYNNQSYEGPV
jgi:hypothetical protein